MKVGDVVRCYSCPKRMGIIVSMWAQMESIDESESPCNTVVVLYPGTGEERMYNDFELENISES